MSDTDDTTYAERVEERAADIDIHPDDQYDDEQVPTEHLDHISWYIVSAVDTFCPIEESADEVIDTLADENDEWDETNDAWERGYHAGSFAQMEDLAGFLWKYDIDVMTRAKRYQSAEDLDEFEMSPEDIQSSVERVLARSTYDRGGDADTGLDA